MQKRKIKYLVMKHLGIRLTTYCNLNCKDCADLLPWQKNCHYDYNLLMQDFGKVLQVIDFLEEVLLGGGEIFLYPYMYDIIKYCISEEKIGKVIIVTNGTIQPSENILELFKNPKVVVRVSGYSEDVVPQREKLITVLQKEHIQIDNLEGMLWFDVGNADCRNRTPQEIEKVWDNCIMNECETMNSFGRIYWCSRSMSADVLDIYPNPQVNEYVDVRNTSIEELGEKLEQFYSLKWISTCNYCDGINRTSPIVPTAAQIVKKDIALELFAYIDTLKSVNNEQRLGVVGSWLDFVTNNHKHLIYESMFKTALQVTLELYEKNLKQRDIDDDVTNKIAVAWNKLVDAIFKKYSFSVKCQTNQVTDAQIKKYNCYVKKNTISVLIIENETMIKELPQSVDIIITLADIAKERIWEQRLGTVSVMRNFLVLDR